MGSVCAGEEKQKTQGVYFHSFLFFLLNSELTANENVYHLTLRMRRIVATPDVAMTLALLGTRFSSMGMTLSAPWSNLLPRIDDKCLTDGQRRKEDNMLKIKLKHH